MCSTPRRVDDGSTGNSGPCFYLDSSPDVGLNSDQARELAALLFELAAQVDGCSGRTADPTAALVTARRALQVAYQATRLVPGKSGDYVYAAIDSIDDAIEVTR